MVVTLLPVFKNGGFDSRVGRLMTLPATTLLTNQWPAICRRHIYYRLGSFGTSAEQVLKKYQVPGTIPSGNKKP